MFQVEGGQILVRDDDGQEYWVGPGRRIRAMHPSSLNGVEDMIGLGDLHEAGILRYGGRNVVRVVPRSTGSLFLSLFKQSVSVRS